MKRCRWIYRAQLITTQTLLRSPPKWQEMVSSDPHGYIATEPLDHHLDRTGGIRPRVRQNTFDEGCAAQCPGHGQRYEGKRALRGVTFSARESDTSQGPLKEHQKGSKKAPRRPQGGTKRAPRGTQERPQEGPKRALRGVTFNARENDTSQGPLRASEKL